MIEETIHIWEAIKQMKILTQNNTPFAFKHGTFNLETTETEGICQVNEALLRPAPSKENVKYAHLKLYYRDVERDLNRNCWQILLMYFNGKKIVL